jgi:hypothetical protein
MNSLMYLLHNILADFMHELVALIHDEGFIADSDRAIFMGLGRPGIELDDEGHHPPGTWTEECTRRDHQ